MTKNILIVGGAGYIGSHTVRELLKKEYNVFVLDNLCKGHKEALSKKVNFIEGNFGDKKLVKKTLTKNNINAVVHFGAFSLVGESVNKPEMYFNNNVTNSKILLDAMVECDVKYMIFSSSAAVYGEPKQIPIKEDFETIPTNPYGKTKLEFEKILKKYDKRHGIKFVSLRYFNAAGADVSGEIGEDHTPESHLIPIIFQVALGQRSNIKIFGTDYNTEDGTCVRDYIHVTDLALAHIIGLESLFKNNKSATYNLGNGKGYSVREIINIIKEITRKDFNIIESDRRQGDPATLIADYSKIKNELNWEPLFGIREILKTAWNWHSKHQKGFKK